MAQRLFERIIQWALLIVTFIYILTGLGITEFRIIEPATFGLLSKNLSFVIHDNLLIPFIVLLVLHIAVKPVRQIYQKRRRKIKLTQINRKA
jgi:cytochrome b subunit of formate dehydrogenase